MSKEYNKNTINQAKTPKRIFTREEQIRHDEERRESWAKRARKSTSQRALKEYRKQFPIRKENSIFIKSNSTTRIFPTSLYMYNKLYTPDGVSLAGKKIKLKVRVFSKFPLQNSRNALVLGETIASVLCAADNCQRRFKKSLNPWFAAKHTKCLHCMNNYERVIWRRDKVKANAAYKSQKAHEKQKKDLKIKLAQAMKQEPAVLTMEQARAIALQQLGFA